MTRQYRLTVAASDAALRLDRLLARHLAADFSRSAIQRAIVRGAVTIAGRPVKSHRLIKAGEVIEVRVEEAPPVSPNPILRPEAIPLEIVYEDDQLLVVNKPPGLVTHPAPGHWSGTLVNALLGYFQTHPTPGTLPRAGIVHRLDKDTSGLLVVAKTEHALRALAAQLKARTMSRRYLAVVEGAMRFEEGTIQAALGRHLRHRKQMAVRYLGGRHAVSHYRVVRRLARPFPHTIVEVRLETGRTHQVRVHLAHLGHPVLGDVVYGRHPISYWQAQGVPRQFLHAMHLRFTHPTRHQDVEVTAPLPPDMATWVGGAA